MRAIRKIAVVGITAAALVGIGLGTSGNAVADPSSTPSLSTLVGVGSDTITPLFAGSPTENTSGSLVTDYNATSPTDQIASWDAVAPGTGAAGGTIDTKASSGSDTSCDLTRPNGSSAGITALNNGQTDTSGDFCINFARSSRAPVESAPFSDTFVAQATDAIAWSYPSVSGLSSPQPSTLTKQDLINIYTCVDTNWDQTSTPGSNAPIIPVVPQAGSGTRSTWLAALGITASSEPCWVNGVDPFNSSLPVEENTGLSTGNTDTFTDATSNITVGTTSGGTTTGSSADVIYPFSIGDWIAQGSAVHGTGTAGTVGHATVGGKATSIWGHGNLNLGETAGETATATNSFSQPIINTNFPTQFFRTLYVVVRNGFSNPTGSSNAAFPTTSDSAGLQAAFSSTGWTCKNVTAQSDEVAFGFTLLGNGCGALSAGH
ncbi:MAG TPA: hypothetical protein VMU95_05775 [Trebonia sp.]|nr:hypothetical protein [Trebonia sp.]